MQRLIKDTKWEVWNDDPKHTLYGTTLHRGARLTILHRETGFTNEAGLPVWDTESAYRDENGNFWCASGNFDARDYPESTVEELILILKNRATVRPDGEEEESK